jgi:hypothetical protein
MFRRVWIATIYLIVENKRAGVCHHMRKVLSSMLSRSVGKSSEEWELGSYRVLVFPCHADKTSGRCRRKSVPGQMEGPADLPSLSWREMAGGGAFFPPSAIGCRKRSSRSFSFADLESVV